MIKSIYDSETEKIWGQEYSKKIPEDVQERGRQKLVQVHSAEKLTDLRTPPGNQLEKLTGDREGQWSIRINQQWRVCFEWESGDAYGVEITDYH
jgi:proteic killer suppression protein